MENSIANTCGELEQEVKSRTYNIIEAFAMMTYCLIMLWLIIYPFGVLMRIEAAKLAGEIFLGLGAIYILFGSPFVHKDTLSSWGLGNPVALYANIRKRSVAGRILSVGLIFLIIASLTFVYCFEWKEASRFIFGLNYETAGRIQATAAGKAAIFLSGIVMATFFSTCVIRYDNFLSALSTAFKIILVLGMLEYATAFIVMGSIAFADFQPRHFALDLLGYMFWGTLQQLLFSSYFGTRFRKGFTPATDPAKQWQKRFWVSVLNGSFFGIIHINSWSLVGICWLLGVILSWVFMEDRNRNLVALGCVQGFLGSSLGWLFAAEKAGGFRIAMGVGPGHMKGFDLLTIVVVFLLIMSSLLVIAYLVRSKQSQN
ncbi:MAG: hypothetical protein PHR77_00595 [Kiritimatiellae bacterium]|nr:hypothetical protein [Kiritimatiellia bacterium]MDD5522917.1 hypothetical protein [Kiritimatiellia bacterium]